MGATVFVLQPLTLEKDISSAQDYGVLNTLLAPGHLQPGDVRADIMENLQTGLGEFNANEDYLLGFGDAALFCLAGAILYQQGHNTIRVLKWDGRSEDYYVVHLPLNIEGVDDDRSLTGDAS